MRPSGGYDWITLFGRTICLVSFLLVCLSCAGRGISIRPHPGVEALTLPELATSDIIQVQYLGTGGYLIQRGRHGLLTAPLYSNPGVWRVGLGNISPDTALINRVHPRIPGVKIAAVLVGHAHYDHLLDVPYIAAHYTREAIIYGSMSVSRLVIAADPSLKSKVRVLEAELARNRQPGDWIYVADSTIRFMAVESDHGPHFLGIHMMKGEVPPGLKQIPKSAWYWREGRTFAYLIDLLGVDGSIDFRIHYQDATSHYPLGAPPRFASQDTHRLDLAIICVDTWDQVPDYPEALFRNHRPRHVIFGHWENFFRSPLKSPWTRFSSLRLRQFIPSVVDALPADSKWVIPEPGAVYLFRPVQP
ncbi:MAG: hypothetical protein JSU77_12910 [Fidelibacterota bacterium]|nr:MAG: hypothetical protein JSU77_12910 [Candidatus Neomarinimicrobiota bacterium]